MMVEMRQSSRKFRETSTPSERVTVTVCWPVNYSCLKPGEQLRRRNILREINKCAKIFLNRNQPLLNRNAVLLVHNNARPHSSKMILKKIKYMLYEILPHPPYSPDLALTDFHLFKHLQHFSIVKINSIVRWMLKMHSMIFLSQKIQIPLRKE